MKIVIEEPLHGWGGGGVSAYVRTLVRELLELDTRNEYALFSYFFRSYRQRRARIASLESPRLRLLLPRWPESVINRLEWGLGLPVIESYLALQGTGLYHAHRIPRRHWQKIVTTVYDLFPVVHPEWGTDYLKELYAKMIRPGLERADAIIAISAHTKRDLIERWHVPPERIEVIHLGVDTSAYHPLEPQATERARTTYRLPERFLLMIGPFDPWSDPGNSMRALAALPKSLSDVSLVMVGHGGSREQDTRRLAAELALTDRVRWLGYVPHADLVSLYNLSLGLLYPSFYEGFGLPVLEAMSCGAPVITSNVTSLPEVAGDAAIQVDPNSIEQLADAIGRLADNAALRADLRSRGLRRVGDFSWKETAKKTLAVYRSAGGAD